MKSLILAMALVLSVAGSAYADVFQLVDRDRNSYLVSYAVYISGRLCGYTDGYGRIRIDRPNGTYKAILRIRNRPDRVIRLSFNGGRTLKIIYVR